ncbi:polysaccharide biosynthesis/export family protein [Spirulina subsalsa]|uniref:polysaccharide biosynthesis/export family protein n=1 Tax=Spirulina subsalsa TaxID=54311 RepID=UPI0002FD7FAC|nr:polysaccharide biosynthesis/export family protein [Spirulina subsalsa]
MPDSALNIRLSRVWVTALAGSSLGIILGSVSPAIAQDQTIDPNLRGPIPIFHSPAGTMGFPVIPPPIPTESDAPPPTFPEGERIPPGYTPPVRDESPLNQFNRYRLAVGDGIAVSVPNFPEFQAAGSINLEGNFSIPILGPISLVGLTIEEAQAKISYELGERFLQRPPEVLVLLNAPRAPDVTVVGEVFEPGFYQLPPGSDPIDAVQYAQGSTQDADLRSVIVRRTLVDGTIIEQSVNLFDPLSQGIKIPTLILQHGDSVIVNRIPVGEEQFYDQNLVARSNVSQVAIAVRIVSHPNMVATTVNLPNGSTFLDAVTQMGSFNQSQLNRIALIRFDPELGRPVVQYLSGRAALQGDLSENPPLRHNDILVVNRNLIGRISYALNTFTQPFRDILGFLLFFNQLVNSASDLFQPGGGGQ